MHETQMHHVAYGIYMDPCKMKNWQLAKNGGLVGGYVMLKY